MVTPRPGTEGTLTITPSAFKLDYAIFADTQEVPGSVYMQLEWLRSLGGTPS
jgi:hypothetical protein